VASDLLEKIDSKFMRKTSILYLQQLTLHALIQVVARYLQRRVTSKFIPGFTVAPNLSGACNALKVLHHLATCEIMREDTLPKSLMNAPIAPKVIIEGIC
jgi:hypothetical protein